MSRVVFTSNIQRHIACPEAEAPGRTVREVLENVFAENPRARSYVLDEQSALRKHMIIFIEAQAIRDLPRVHAYDIVYRHALAIDHTGDRLAFGSTTGGLWVSEDQGDRWTCVTRALPPVYAAASRSGRKARFRRRLAF